jgi:hypothetical protein
MEGVDLVQRLKNHPLFDPRSQDPTRIQRELDVGSPLSKNILAFNNKDLELFVYNAPKLHLVNLKNIKLGKNFNYQVCFKLRKKIIFKLIYTACTIDNTSRYLSSFNFALLFFFFNCPKLHNFSSHSSHTKLISMLPLDTEVLAVTATRRQLLRVQQERQVPPRCQPAQVCCH